MCLLLWTSISDKHLIIVQSFTLTDDEMESQPTLQRIFFMRLSNRVFEREVNRQRYNDAAKDADWKEALIIHTLISLCLRSQWTPYIFSEDYLPVLTTLEMLKVSSSRRPSSWSSSFYTKKWAHRLETASDVFTTQTDNESTSVAYSSICTFFY